MHEDISTIILVRELEKRISDWNKDPEPQYDCCLSRVSKARTKMLGYCLEAFLKKYSEETLKELIQNDPVLLEQYGDQLP
jgi:hypothetical protein